MKDRIIKYLNIVYVCAYTLAVLGCIASLITKDWAQAICILTIVIILFPELKKSWDKIKKKGD